MSYLNVLDEPTTFEETVLTHASTFPSITFCQRDWAADKFETIEDIMDAIKNTMDNHIDTAQFYLVGKGDNFLYDLKNSSIISSKLNVSFGEVWSHAPHVQDWGSIAICTTLHFPFVLTPPKQGTYGVT